MEQNILEQILEGGMEPTYLPLEILREITDGFSTNRIIGEGGFGTVYKGTVGNRNVAVKRIRSSMTVDDKLFRREVGSLMEVNHQNVVRFLGLCSHTVEAPIKNPESRGYIFAEIRERLLCFEYISNGSLDTKITDELRGLDWDKRFEIIKGICTGLHYLHMEKRILHMDLKPANILLDNDMKPKITDFGLSRPAENSQTMSTGHFVSRGYCAPENLFGSGRMSFRSDIYSLGVIIIELVTGHKCIPYTNDNILRRWRHRWNKSTKEISLEYHEQVTKCIEIGSLCQKVDPYARPSISEIMRNFEELESMDNCRTTAHDSTVGQIKPPYWEDDMLGVEPLELQFANSGNDKQHILSCSVELSNDTNSFIAFKVQTTSLLPYSIEPSKDILKPRSKCSVDITLPAANSQDHNKQYTKEFIVQSIKVNDGLETNDINEDLFDKHITGLHVDEIYLSVISEKNFNKEVTDSPGKQAKQYASSEARSTPIKPGSVNLVINNSRVAPLLEYHKKVMLELTGGDYTSDRPGLDLVVVVEVSGSMQGKKMAQLKTAMRFVLQKLSPMDRLSVITCSDVVEELWPLRQIKQRELQDLIYELEPSDRDGNNMREGLQAGLNVLGNREVWVGRVNAIMLVSSGCEYYDYEAVTFVDAGDVPVYTFCFGSTQLGEHVALAEVAAKSIGGTFSHVVDHQGGLTMAFSQCLAGLLTVAVQNLELTVSSVRGESTIVKVTAGSYPQEHHKNDENDSVTVRFGNLYSAEVRKVIVELLLPTIHSERSAEILDVSYSHKRSAGRMKLVGPTETLTVWRTGAAAEDEKPARWLLSGEAHLQMAQMIKEARTMAAGSNRLDDAQNKLVEAHNMLVDEEQSNSLLLRTELQHLSELFKTQETFHKKGRPYALSSESSHNRQRFAWKGADIQVMPRLFATPRMDMYLEQANKFLNEPRMPLPSSVDDDVKQEVSALAVNNVASREEEMRRLALDVVLVRKESSNGDNIPGGYFIGRPGNSMPSPPHKTSRGLFGIFRKKGSGGR